ncbi:MAG: phosphate ABC transporter substrate-binding protein PstS [Archaeoglobaceae archaeon]|nr:phosphate ABC transporter substrate-binding protein PstS [Archaeoglobaceae archaeon]
MIKWASLLIAALSVAILAGCVSQSGEKVEKTVKIHGSGASFPAPQLYNWISEFSKVRKDIVVEYASKGSGAGINDFKLKLVHFACTDPPAKESEWREFEKVGKPLQFPFIVGAVVVVFNVPEVKELKLDGSTVAKIFLGEIEFWDDEAIKALNPNAKLPHEKIVVIHRSDSSGTTEVFTTYLSMVSREFKEKVGAGKLVDWPVDKLGRGYGGKGNEGVAAMLKQTPYSVGYVELAYAIHEKMNQISLRNAEGRFVSASSETISAAISATKSFIPDPREGYKEDLKQFINAPGEKSYPIVAFSHVLIWEKYDNKDEAFAVKEFWKWILKDGRKYVIEGYVPLPPEVAEIALKAVERVS